MNTHHRIIANDFDSVILKNLFKYFAQFVALADSIYIII